MRKILFAGTHPADGITAACGASNFKICIDEVTAYGACWKSAPTVPSGCPAGANLNDAVRAGTLWGASSDGSYHYDSTLNCPLCYAPGAGGGGGSNSGKITQVMLASITDSRSLGVAADASGTVTVGWFRGAIDFGTGSRGQAGTNSSHPFIVKYNPNLESVAWAKLLLGGGDNNTADGVAIDSQGNVIVVGAFTGTVDFEPDNNVTNANDTLTSGGTDIYVAKYTTGGTLLWVRNFGGGFAQGKAVAVDANNNIFFGGLMSNVDSRFAGTPAGTDIALGKIPASGSTSASDGFWGKRWGGSSLDAATAVAVDRTGNVVVTGYQSASNGLYDIFLAKCSGADGSFIWPTKVIGGASTDVGYSIATDPATGNIWVTGLTGGVTAGPNDFGDNKSAGAGMFLARYTPSGTLQWKNIIGSSTSDGGYALRINSNGVLALAGTLLTSVNFGEWWFGNGNINYFVVTYTIPGSSDPTDADLTFRWAWRTGAGTNGTSLGYGVAFDASNNVVTSGIFQGVTDFGTKDTRTSGVVRVDAPLAPTQTFIAQYNK